MYTYKFFGRHVALIYGVVALIVLAPLPFWIELLFGYEAQHENAVLIFAGTGIVVALSCVWSDINDRHYFATIDITGDGIKSYQKGKENYIRWNDIVRLEHLRYIDIERNLAWGAKGVRIVDKNDQKILVFSTIRDYWGLIKMIEEKTKMSFKG